MPGVGLDLRASLGFGGAALPKCFKRVLMLLLCSTSPHLAAALLTGEKQFITLCWTSAVVSALSGHEFSAEVCSTCAQGRFPGVGKNNKKVAGELNACLS